jgi:hypothetical protein
VLLEKDFVLSALPPQLRAAATVYSLDPVIFQKGSKKAQAV